MVLKEAVSLQDTSDKLMVASSEQWLPSLKAEIKIRWAALIADTRLTEICTMLLVIWIIAELWLQEL